MSKIVPIMQKTTQTQLLLLKYGIGFIAPISCICNYNDICTVNNIRGYHRSHNISWEQY